VLLQAVRELLCQGLIEVELECVVENDLVIQRAPEGSPGLEDDDLKRYWFVLTPAGWEKWSAGSGELQAHYNDQPLQRRDQSAP
jgi:hypothetical protein